MWHTILPILTFVVGFIAGAIVVGFYVKKKFSSLMTSPDMISTLAKSMGYNLNQKQLNKVTKSMQGGVNLNTKTKSKKNK
jgi:hypothetical protein